MDNQLAQSLAETSCDKTERIPEWLSRWKNIIRFDEKERRYYCEKALALSEEIEESKAAKKGVARLLKELNVIKKMEAFLKRSFESTKQATQTAMALSPATKATALSCLKEGEMLILEGCVKLMAGAIVVGESDLAVYLYGDIDRSLEKFFNPEHYEKPLRILVESLQSNPDGSLLLESEDTEDSEEEIDLPVLNEECPSNQK